MAAGKIPLIDAESLSLVAAFRAANVDALPIFLTPQSHDAYKARVAAWLQETPRALARYDVAARRQAAAVLRAQIYDQVITNTKLNQAVEDAVALSKKLRPDLFKDVSTGEDDPYAKEPWGAVRVVYLSGHAQLSRRDALLPRLLAALPEKLAALPESTTRKAAKDETEGVSFYFGAKAAELQKAKDEGRVLSWRQVGADTYARTTDSAAALYAKTGKLALLPLDDAEAAAMAAAGLRPEVTIVHVSSSTCTALHCPGSGYSHRTCECWT